MVLKTLAIALLWTTAAAAQCAMCYRTAQSLDAARGRVLNSAILVLGMPPLLLLTGFAILISRRNH